MPGSAAYLIQVSPTKLRARIYAAPTSSQKSNTFVNLHKVLPFRNFLQSFGIILAVFCSAKFHTAEQISIYRIVPRMTVPHCGIGESAIPAPLFRQLPQWSNLLRHDTLRMTKFVCSAVPLPSAGEHPPTSCRPRLQGRKTMAKNAIVGQSGGPTSVINASLAGVYESCKRRGRQGLRHAARRSRSAGAPHLRAGRQAENRAGHRAFEAHPVQLSGFLPL